MYEITRSIYDTVDFISSVSKLDTENIVFTTERHENWRISE